MKIKSNRLLDFQTVFVQETEKTNYNIDKQNLFQGGTAMKAVIYARHNTPENEEDSFQSQLEDCRKYAKEHEIEVVDEYIDGTFGCLERGERRELAQLLEDSEERTFDLVLVAEMSCLSRCYFEMISCLQRLQKNGVTVKSVRFFLPDKFRPVEECYKMAFDRKKVVL